jgi:ZIP family zinc transporter
VDGDRDDAADEPRARRAGWYPSAVALAGLWSFVGAVALLVGAGIALWFQVGPRVVGAVMGFGAGTLISAVSFDLVVPAYHEGTRFSMVAGMLLGALAYMGGDVALDRYDRRSRAVAVVAEPEAVVPPRLPGEAPGGSVSGPQLVLGSVLDGVPESVAIGITILANPSGTVSIAMVAAVFLSNIPEGLSATIGLRDAGRTPRFVVGLWSAIVVVSVLAAVVGYELLGGASPDVLSFVQAFAAGTILTMLANTMMPEAFTNGGRAVGLITVIGFILASGLTAIGG